MKAQEMAKMFDLELPAIVSASAAPSESSDYGSSKVGDNSTSFDQRVDDIKSVLEQETPTTAPNDDPPVVGETVDAAEIGLENTDSESESEICEADLNIPGDVSSGGESAASNPLGLKGQDLIAYEKIKKQYPEFVLYDGSKAFLDFYQWKTRMLKNALTRFPILPIGDLRRDLRTIELDHQVGSERVVPELIRQKLDNSYACRIRMVTLLLDAYEQFPAWKRILEMLKSKLFKDHAQKGAHNREALVLEHLSDVDFYTCELEGFITAAKHIDGMLQAAAESLSRQLSCIQLKEPTGTSYHEKAPADVGSGLDEFDSIGDGTFISKPESMGSVVEEDFGVVKSDPVVDIDIG